MSSVLLNSRESFVEGYEYARTKNKRIPRQKDSDGFNFKHPLYLLHLGGEAGAIVSEETHEIASLFNAGKKGLGKEVVKTAIAYGGTWLYAWSHLKHLIEYYESLGFERVIDVACWNSKEICMTYLALPNHHDDIKIKTSSGCVSLNDYLVYTYEDVAS